MTVRFQPMPPLYGPDASCDIGGDTMPGAFGHTVISSTPVRRPLAPATVWDPSSETNVVDIDDHQPLISRPLSVILRYLAPSHQAYLDQVDALQLIRRCAAEVQEDWLAIEALGLLASYGGGYMDPRGAYMRAFDEASSAPEFEDGGVFNGKPSTTTWELLALDSVVQIVVSLDRFQDSITEGK